MERLPRLASTLLGRRSFSRNTFVVKRSFSKTTSNDTKGDVLDLLSRGSKTEVTTSRFKLGSSDVKLEELSEFSDNEKLLEFDDGSEEQVEEEEYDDSDPNEELYLSEEEYMQKIIEDPKTTWPVKRTIILKNLKSLVQGRETGPGITEDLDLPVDEGNVTADLEICDDPLTKHLSSSGEEDEDLIHIIEETETAYYDLLNFAVDRVKEIEKKENKKYEKLGKVLAKQKEIRKNRKRDPTKMTQLLTKSPVGYTLGAGNYFGHITSKLPESSIYRPVVQSNVQTAVLNPTWSFKQKNKLADDYIRLLANEKEDPIDAQA